MTDDPRSRAPDPSSPPGGNRVGALPAFGCFLLIVVGVILWALGPAGEFWSLGLLALLAIGGGIGVTVYLARRNRGGGGSREG